MINYNDLTKNIKDGLKFPTGATSERGTPSKGSLRFNSETGKPEIYAKSRGWKTGVKIVAGGFEDANVVLQTGFEGNNGDTSIVDDTGNHTLSFIANSQPAYIDNTLYRTGSHSAHLTATSISSGNNSYISIPASSDFDFGTGDFTIELWHYCSQYSGTYTIFSSRFNQDMKISKYGNRAHVKWQYDDTNWMYAYYALWQNVWQHLVFQRKNGQVQLIVDGDIKSTANYTGQYGTSDQNLQLGLEHISMYGYPNNFYVDQLRISKGIGRYTAPFTPTISYPLQK